MKKITDATFNTEVIEAQMPVLVDLWAPWCGPCKTIAPHLEQLATEMPGVNFVKVNVDDCQDIATALSIRSIPTLMIFKGGKQVASMVGGASKATLKTFIEEGITK
jgi:thioredoxin 1